MNVDMIVVYMCEVQIIYSLLGQLKILILVHEGTAVTRELFFSHFTIALSYTAH